MMPLRRRVCFLPITSCARPKFIGNGHSTLNKYLKNSVVDPSLKDFPKNNNANIIKPHLVKPDAGGAKVGAELVGDLSKTDILTVVKSFLDRNELEIAASENGVDGDMCGNVKISFEKYCEDVENLPSDLYIILCDIVKGHKHVLDMLPYFLQHALLMYPHLKYKEELHRIGDLTSPEMWFQAARSIKRKIYFHYGPTNSGKTHNALERFLTAERGVYCSPLKLLAHEIFEKANSKGVPCDLVTGEDKRKVLPDGSEANHISCTVEMTSVTNSYDVAVIDEIQMIKDINRGYAWTRALLGIAAKEIHLCGESGALEYIQETAKRLGEEIECIQYKRLTKLYFEHKAVETFENIQDGDCIICFSKKEIFHVTKALEERNIGCAVIYGTLPPGTKASQCKKFNDAENKCNVLVATDAVGLGLNLNIRRIVFYNIEKLGEVIPVSHALQIAGRAGRFNSRYDKGYVTAFRQKDVKVLQDLLQGIPEPVTKAGLLPTVEQIETFSYYLPDSVFTELIDIFSALCTLSERYFMCDLNNFKRLAMMLQHTPLSVKSIYTFCCAPVNSNSLMNQTLFVKFAKKYSLNEVITVAFMRKYLSWPLKKPLKIQDLELLEEAYDCLDLYLWFGNRFPTLFPDTDAIRALQEELDGVIMNGIVDIAQVIKRSDKEETTEVNLKKTEESLIQKGILTPVLLAKLKNEWLKDIEKKKKVKS